jgi:hypothetical protein
MPYNVQGLPQINPRDIMLQYQNQHNPLATASSFENIMGKIGTGLQAIAPVAISGLNYGGFTKGSAITSAAIMGFPAAGGSSFSTPGMGAPQSKFNSWGSNPGMKALGMPGAPPGYPGAGATGGIPGAPPGFGGTSTAGFPGMGGGAQDVSQFDSQIDAMMNNNMLFLALQTKVQNMSQMTQASSNILKTASDANLNAVRNLRAG